MSGLFLEILDENYNYLINPLTDFDNPVTISKLFKCENKNENEKFISENWYQIS